MHNGDLLPTLPLDRVGQKWGWRLELAENLPQVTEAVRKGRPVAVFQDAGRPRWWEQHGPWPHAFERLDAWPTDARWEALLVISDRLLSLPPAGLRQRMLVYRPPSLMVGVACRRGVQQEELEESLARLFDRHRLCLASLTGLAGSVKKKHEAGVVGLAEDRAIPFLTYAKDKLLLAQAARAAPPLVKAAGACEPAALLAAGVTELVVPKTLFRRVSLAVARRPFA
jgi:cobalt-precorrin 5A hydrolase